jgi:hypothetical protein
MWPGSPLAPRTAGRVMESDLDEVGDDVEVCGLEVDVLLLLGRRRVLLLDATVPPLPRRLSGRP